MKSHSPGEQLRPAGLAMCEADVRQAPKSVYAPPIQHLVRNPCDTADKRELSSSNSPSSIAAAPSCSVSYKRGGCSQKMAQSLCDALEVAGALVRIDFKTIRLRGDVKEFAHEMSTADYFAVVLNREYLHSLHCMRELHYMVAYGCRDRDEEIRKRIIPLVIDRTHDATEGIDPLDATLHLELETFWQGQLDAKEQTESRFKGDIAPIRYGLTGWLETIGHMNFNRDLDAMAASGWREVVDVVMAGQM